MWQFNKKVLCNLVSIRPITYSFIEKLTSFSLYFDLNEIIVENFDDLTSKCEVLLML